MFLMQCVSQIVDCNDDNNSDDNDARISLETREH